MSKRVLLISYYFAPQNTIGAIRPTKMAKYLERMGHEVTVICGGGLDDSVDPTLKRDMEQMKDVRILKEWNPLRKHYERKTEAKVKQAQSEETEEKPVAKESILSRAKQRFAKLADAVYLYLNWLSDRHFGMLAKREIRKLQGRYDCVFSSYASHSVHEAACYAKKLGKAEKWIADFRDEVNMSFRFQEGRKARYMKMVRENADIISAVSSGFLEMMELEKIGRVLSNGFDIEDLPAVQPQAREDGKLRVVYCGFISEGRKNVANRDLSPMMRALRRLVDEKALAGEQLHLVYAGTESHLFRQAADAYGLLECVEDHGLVSRQESIALQLGADILLMASWHMANQRGILTGKLFEYMMMNKPVVCCMAGDVPGSGVKTVLDETGIGFCCEQANGENDEELLFSYVRTLVERYHQKQPLLDSSKSEAIQAYAYPALAAELSRWIEE